MHWATVSVVIVLIFMLYSTSDFGVTTFCRPPNCSKRPKNKTCRRPCVGYFCANGTLMVEKCKGEGDPLCTIKFRGNGKYPDCCGVAMCTTSRG
uniref:8.9 kDa family member n=1 Tax=Rhipicephalus appendiculatus TaxID=34631 RepID=A0A131Z4Q9_RHIAP